jgi:F-type H+-transporting ATPase subunit a
MPHRFYVLLTIAFGLFLAFALPGVAQAAAAGGDHGGAEHHTLPLKPAELFHLGPFTITNSMVVTWAVAAGIILLAQLATRSVKPVPTGLQNFWEWMVESLYNFLESMIGPDLVKKTFWFFATIFIFHLCLNWFGLLPGRRHRRLGTHHAEWHLPSGSPAASWRERRPKPHVRDGVRLLRLLVRLGSAGERRGGMISHIFGAKARAKASCDSS